MDVKKVVFEADVDQIDIKPLLKKEFLELTMRAISTANPNRNNSWFTKESLEASIGSFKNKPILGYFENGDFVSHNGEWKEDPETQLDYWDTLTGKGERPIGMIRETDEVKVVDDPETGLSWAVLTCALWTQYNYKQVKRLLKDAKKAKEQGGPTKNVSVEVDITDYEYLPNGVMKINAFNLVGITILGSRNGIKVEPGIEDAELSVVDIMGTALYEKQMQSLRLAYEKLGGSETNKEDFSEMEQNIQENSELENQAGAVQEGNTDVPPTGTPTEGNTNPEGSQEENAHFEENHENGTSDTANNDENNNGQPDEAVHQNNEAGEGDNTDGTVHANEEVDQDVIRDIGYLINNCSWNIEDFEYSIQYYEEHEDIQGREYILPVLRRMKTQAIANEKELAELMGKVAGEITEEEIQFEKDLCDHCDCKAEFTAYNELMCKYNDLVKECDALKMAKEGLECKFAEIEEAKAHAKFVEDAKVLINNAKFDNEIALLFVKECEEGKYASLDELKTQIGLKLYELRSAEEENTHTTETSTFDAPVSNPDTNSFTDEGPKAKKKDKWEALRDISKK